MPAGSTIGRIVIFSKDRFVEIVKKAWISETSAGGWTSKCPSIGQCAVTAMLVQDYFGGDLLRCELSNGGSHYWNLLPGAEEWDLTEDQFEYLEDVEPLYGTTIIRKRSYLEGNNQTMKRYRLLRKRFKQIDREMPE